MIRPAAGGRRGFLRLACAHCVGFAGLAGAAERDASPRLQRPALDTDEGGMWAQMDREETRIRRSSFAVRDEPLSRYMHDLVCRLGGDHCSDVRVHVIRTPMFNASMAPNGMMQVWTGLLLRVDNDAQLAAVLGHELGHYFERHMLERLRDLKARSALATFLGVFGLVGAVAGLGVIASHFGFSRDQEEQADRIGVQLMKKAGFDASEAARVWEHLLSELQANGDEEAGKRSVMFATHPPTAQRRDALVALAGERGATPAPSTGSLEAVVAPFRLDWLHDEIRRGQHEESIALFDRKLKARPDDPLWLYGRGEVRRQRNQGDDLALAVADLTRGGAGDKPPAELFRSLGLAHQRRGERLQALSAFQRYLALTPEAGDAGLIKTYLSGEPS